MDIADWRKRIDEIDEKLVVLLNERAKAAQQIGYLKQQTRQAIQEPQREREVFDRVRQHNGGPLPDRDVMAVFERIIDVMRKLQLHSQSRAAVQTAGTEMEAETNE